MRWIALAVLATAALAPHNAAAQATPRPVQGEAVRVTAADASGHYTLERMGDGQLGLRDRHGLEITVPLADIQSLAVARPRSRGGGALKGAGIGFLAGAATGVAIGMISGDDDPNEVFIAFSAGEKAIMAGSLIGVGGAVVGALVGFGSPGLHWVDVPLQSLDAARSPDGGLALRMRLIR